MSSIQSRLYVRAGAEIDQIDMIAIDHMLEQRVGQQRAGRSLDMPLVMRQLVDIGGAVLHRPELRRDRLAVDARHAHAQPPGLGFALGQPAQEFGIALLGLPAARIDGFVIGPVLRVEAMLDAERDHALAALALDGGAQLARAILPVFGKAAPFQVQHMVLVARFAADDPAGRSEGLLDQRCRAAFVGHGGEDQPVRRLAQLLRDRQHECAPTLRIGCAAENRAPDEAVPVGHRAKARPAVVDQVQLDRIAPIGGIGDMRGVIGEAVAVQPVEPERAVEQPDPARIVERRKPVRLRSLPVIMIFIIQRHEPHDAASSL